MKRISALISLAIAASVPTLAFTQEVKDKPTGADAIKKLGSIVEMDSAGKVVKVSLRNTKLTDEDMVCFDELKDLQELDLSHTSVSNKSLAHLEHCTKLTKLNLAFTKVGDHGLHHLKHLTKLKWLDLERPAKDERHCITDAGLKSLKHLKELEYVNLSCNHATEAGLTEFKKVMPKVKVAASPAETQIK